MTHIRIHCYIFGPNYYILSFSRHVYHYIDIYSVFFCRQKFLLSRHLLHWDTQLNLAFVLEIQRYNLFWTIFSSPKLRCFCNMACVCANTNAHICTCSRSFKSTTDIQSNLNKLNFVLIFSFNRYYGLHCQLWRFSPIFVYSIFAAYMRRSAHSPN